VLHSGAISEMKTGEGKTFVAPLAAYLNGLTGRGVHVVTVNDYLAKRDAQWIGQVFWQLGMSVGSIQHEAAYLVDPANPNGSLTAGIAALDGYLASTDSTGRYRNEALVLRRTAVTAQAVNAIAASTVATVASTGTKDTVVVAKSRDEEIAALKDQLAKSKDELAKVSAELDRIKKRLANPNN